MFQCIARDSQPQKINRMELLPKVLHKWIPTVWIFTTGDKPIVNTGPSYFSTTVETG